MTWSVLQVDAKGGSQVFVSKRTPASLFKTHWENKMKARRSFTALLTLLLALVPVASAAAGSGGGILVATGWEWCMDKVGDVSWCTNYLGPYANDKIVMKWNAEWDRGNAEGWSNPPYDAWENNQWNGMVPGGSGETWHYKFVWVGPCGPDGTSLENGGYCIWGQFAVISSHGTAGHQHLWEVLASPAGYGAYP